MSFNKENFVPGVGQMFYNVRNDSPIGIWNTVFGNYFLPHTENLVVYVGMLTLKLFQTFAALF